MKTYFHSEVGLIPDFIFECVLFDPKVRQENGLATPLLGDIGPQYDNRGAYVFFEPCNQNSKIEIMWVGRSEKLRNRITNHWGNYSPKYDQENIIEIWGNYCWGNDFPFCPHVAIFISHGNLKDLEHNLMQLKPRFNTH